MSQSKQKEDFVKSIDFTWMKPNMEIWMHNTDTESPEVFLKAKLLDANLDTGEVKIEYNKETQLLKGDQIYPMNKVNAAGFNDMVDMENLNEAELLYNIKLRYEQNKIFTYVGPTLLAINPYMPIPELVNEEVLKNFQAKASDLQFNIKDHQPHIYGIAGDVFHALLENKKNQAIVISGESGAGKTEETKLAMKFITSMGKSQHLDHMKMIFSTNNMNKSTKFNKFEDDQDLMGIEDKILSCNPILEAFGNAKTVRNDNSSRFGKLVLLLFQKDSRKIKGAVTTNYLLEKSRITAQAIGERNYHIFYFLMKGASKELITELELEDMKKYDYLKKSNCFSVPTINDESCYKEVCESFDTMKFSKSEVSAIWHTVSAILHLGNIDFSEKTLDNNNPCTILLEKEVEKAAKLLGLDEKDFVHNLLHKTRIVGKQEINSKLNRNDCLSLRDSFTKGLYERMFIWIVRRLNYAISTEEYRKKKFEEIMMDKERLSIGLLDIFGFEVFKINSFEQFCINFANEKLQQLYIAYVFKAEIDEFNKEGLKAFLFELKFKDNQPIIDLLEKNPMGIYNLIDESSSVSSTDDTLLQTIIKTHNNDSNFKLPKMPKETFIIIHTAKDVEYNIQGFRSKNKDELPNTLCQLMKTSSFNMVSDIFSITISGQNFEEEEAESPQNRGKSKTTKGDKFLGAKFRLQMRDLMFELNSSECHFVRCIKPNEAKQKQLWVPQLALLQIRYLGVLESIKIRKESYPVRRLYNQFYEKYFEISNESLKTSYIEFIKTNPDYKELSKNIISKNLPGVGTDKVLFGTTKIFMRVDKANVLDNILLEKIKIKTVMACRIQRSFFCFIQMKKIRRFFRALKRIQNLIKVRSEHKKFRDTIKKTKKIQQSFKKKLFRKGVTQYFEKLEQMKKGTTKIASHFKMKRARTQFLAQKDHINDIIRLIRGFLARRKVKRIRIALSIVKNIIFEKAWKIIRRVWEKEAAIIIQKYARRYIVKRKFKKQIIKIKKAKQDVIDRKAAVIIQKYARTYLVKQFIRKNHRAAFKIQGYMKMKWLSALFQSLRSNVIKIQKIAKKWLLNRHIRKERWIDYDNSDMNAFQKVKCQERDNVFGKKDIATKLNGFKAPNHTHSSSVEAGLNLQTQTSEKPKNFVRLEKEEDLLNLFENEEDENISEEDEEGKFYKSNNSGEFNEQINDLNESGLLEELIGYQNSNSKQESKSFHTSQKPVQSDKELYDIDSNRKIVLFPLIVDIDMLGDTSDIYKPMWSQLYNSNKQECLRFDSSIQLIEVGETFTLCMNESGKTFSWGQNDFFQLGRNVSEVDEGEKSSIGCLKLELSEHSQLQKIIAGDNHVFALDNQKNLFCWGDNYNGQLGLGHNKIVNEIVLNKILPLKKIVDIQSKGNLNLGLTDEGEILMWPFQKSNGKYFYKPVSLPLPSGVLVASVSCGNNFAVLTASNGMAYSFGKDNSEGQLGLGDIQPRNVPTLIESFKNLGEKIVTISCGFKHVICKSTLGKIFVWGAGDMGQLGIGGYNNELLPKLIKPEKYSDQKHSVNKVLQIKAGFRCCMILLDNRKVYWWGTNSVLERVFNPKCLDYGVFLELGDNEKTSDFIPIRLLSTWNKTCSIMYITLADTTRVSSHLPVIQKCCNNLASKWDTPTIDPPYIESFSKHFTFKALRKIAVKQRKKKKGNNNNEKKEKRPITKEERELLYQIFLGRESRKLNKTGNSSIFRAKSPLRNEKNNEDDRDEDLRSIKTKAINLMKTPKDKWKDSDHELMVKLSEPEILALMKMI